jgi:hypothetical protein
MHGCYPAWAAGSGASAVACSCMAASSCCWRARAAASWSAYSNGRPTSAWLSVARARAAAAAARSSAARVGAVWTSCSRPVRMRHCWPAHWEQARAAYTAAEADWQARETARQGRLAKLQQQYERGRRHGPGAAHPHRGTQGRLPHRQAGRGRGMHQPRPYRQPPPQRVPRPDSQGDLPGQAPPAPA